VSVYVCGGYLCVRVSHVCEGECVVIVKVDGEERR
jgi:hypothetical protein